MIKLGQRVVDQISGFKGVVTASSHYINGCNRYQVTAENIQNNEVPVSEWFDEQQLLVKGKKLILKADPELGGSRPNPQRNDAPKP
jgi:hypothetical protein